MNRYIYILIQHLLYGFHTLFSAKQNHTQSTKKNVRHHQMHGWNPISIRRLIVIIGTPQLIGRAHTSMECLAPTANSQPSPLPFTPSCLYLILYVLTLNALLNSLIWRTDSESTSSGKFKSEMFSHLYHLTGNPKNRWKITYKYHRLTTAITLSMQSNICLC